MSIYFFVLYFLLFLGPANSKPRYVDLDEEDQQLFRAAYDTPAYDHDEYEEEPDLQPGKLDLIKDGLWALKAKMKELKAFNKALAANMLSTKLKVKEMLTNQLLVKKQIKSEIIENKKPTYAYQPAYPQYEHYGGPQYPHDPYYGH